MFWIILFGVSLIGAIAWVIHSTQGYSEEVVIAAIVSVLILSIFCLPVIQCFWWADSDIDKFIATKNYIENHEQTDKYEYVALMETKIERNEWLFRVQANKRHMPFFSLYPDEILELEPIE